MAHSRIENPTLIERFVKLIPLPYPLAALVWSAVLTGPVFDVIAYLTTGATPVSLASLPNALLNFLLPFYLFLMIRYMRLRVVASEALIAPRLSGGVQDYQRAFGRLTQTAPAITLTAIMGTLLLAFYATSGILPSAPALIVANVIIVYLNILAFSTYFWEFATASLGLHKL